MMNATFLLLAFSIGLGPDEDAAASLALAQAAKNVEMLETYDQAKARAINDQVHLIVFVGVDQRKSATNASVKVEAGRFTDDGYPTKCVIVSDTNGKWQATLAHDATDQQIADAIKGVKDSPTPFRSGRSLRHGERAHPVDADQLDPQLRALLKGMEPYTSSRMTQTTFRRWQGYIAPSPRGSLENKWQVPGHLDGIDGWSSTLYRTRGTKASVFLVRQDPSDGSSAVTWDRSYPDGMEFVDILRNADGKMFEARVATKKNGEWERYVAFRDPDARPHGYTKPTSKQCIECHGKAGRSEYGGAAIPGGDTVLSDPMDPLEYGGTVQGGYGTKL